MKQQLAMITEKTGLPIGMVFGSIPFLVGGIFWLSSLHYKVSDVSEIKNDVKKIAKDIAYIKGALDIKETVKNEEISD